MFPPRNCHPLITSPKTQHNWHRNGRNGTIGTKTRQSCQHIQMGDMEGSSTHPLFFLFCHRIHMHTLQVFFLTGVSRGLQLIHVIAPRSPHTHTHTKTHMHPSQPLHPTLPTFLIYPLAPQSSCFNPPPLAHTYQGKHTQNPKSFLTGL